MDYNSLLNGVKTYINELYVSNDKRRLPYHNFSHSTEIVNILKQLLHEYKLDDKTQVLMEVAVWFSQAGFITEARGNPAFKSVQLAAGYLSDQNVPQADIDLVTDCIKAALGLTPPPNLTCSKLSVILSPIFMELLPLKN